MIGNVLVPLDGSDLAEETLPYAGAIATRSNAVLHLVRVLPVDAKAEAEHVAREYLQQQARQFGDRAEVHVRLGDPAEQIVEAGAEMADGIIVITTHGRSGIGRWLFGSVADRVVHNSEAPVLLVRSGLGPPRAVRSILVPLDGSAYAEAALPSAIDLARAFDAELHLVRVAETAQVYSMLTRQTPAESDVVRIVVERLVADATDYVEKTTERMRAGGLHVVMHLREGIPTEEILAVAREAGIDLTVVATHGRSGLNRLVFGSVAERILRQGTTPILMVRPAGEIEGANRPGGRRVRREADVMRFHRHRRRGIVGVNLAFARVGRSL